MAFYVPSVVSFSYSGYLGRELCRIILIWKGGASDPSWRVQVLGVRDGWSGGEGDQETKPP